MDITVLIGLFLGIALIDSINPSALIATGYLLKNAPESRKVSSILAYVTGIFCFYFAVGILLLFGFSFVRDVVGSLLESTAAYIIQAIIGVGLFIWSWIPPKPAHEKRWRPASFGLKTIFILGVTITLIEFTTAIPYLGAITLLQNAEITLVAKLGLLFIYNIIFVLPPLGLLVFYYFNRQRFIAWQAKREAKQAKEPDTTMQWIAGIVGVLLFLNALSGLGITDITIGQ